MNRTLFLIIVGLQLSCASHNEIIGTWTSQKYSTWERGIAYLKGSRGMVRGKEIIFNPDFTYTESFNGRVNTGKWHVVNDSLYMNANQFNKQPGDSTDISDDLVHLTKPQGSFAIREGKLIKYHSGNYCRRRRSDGSIDKKDNFIVEILRRSE